MFDTTKEDLKDILRKAHEGRLQLPDFQRDYVWGDEDVRSLIASIAKGFPVGALLTLENGGEVRFKPRLLAGVPLIDVAPAELLLDGQQRITSLYQVAYSQAPVRTKTPKGTEIARYYYLDINLALSESASIEDAIVGVPADRIVRENFGRDRVWERHGYRADGDAAEIPPRHRALAVADHRGLPGIIDIDDRLIRRRIFHMPRHVFHMSVRKMRTHRELLRRARLEFHEHRLDLQFLNARIIRLRPRRTLRDPLDERLPVRRIDLELLPALVRHGICRLQQKQRARRIGGRNPSSKSPARQREVIAFIVITPQRKLKPALPRRRSMTRPERAPHLREDRLDVIAEADRRRVVGKRGGGNQKQREKFHGGKGTGK